MPDETQLDCGERDKAKPDIYRIGPFADGDPEKGEKDERGNVIKLDEKIRALAKNLNDGTQRGKSLQGLILVGSVDKRPLSPALARNFGSNTGLAQARAEWVRNAIVNEKALSPMPKTILTLSSGPAHIGHDLLPKDLAEDRSVRVCAIWGSK